MRGMATSPKPIPSRALGHAPADKRIDILKQVARCGSISEAARVSGVSYKAAWQAIHTLSGLAGTPVVQSSVGGPGGGGARITPAGRRLLKAASWMDEARHQVLARVNALPGSAADAPEPPLNAPRTSMRNLLRCHVQALHSADAQDPLVRVQLRLPGGGALHSLITRESAELLGLSPGLPVLALCKATAVRVQPAPPASAPPANDTSQPNQLAGRIERMARGALQDEATLLIDGMPLSGFAARPNRLRAGSRAVALVDGSAVVIALG